jgi:hypothetical protein
MGKYDCRDKDYDFREHLQRDSFGWCLGLTA